METEVEGTSQETTFVYICISWIKLNLELVSEKYTIYTILCRVEYRDVEVASIYHYHKSKSNPSLTSIESYVFHGDFITAVNSLFVLIILRIVI